MADTKISDLTALTGADAATTDVFPVVDVSANTTKKMTRAEMFQNTPPIAVTGTLSAGAITSSTNTGWTLADDAGRTLAIKPPLVATGYADISTTTNHGILLGATDGIYFSLGLVGSRAILLTLAATGLTLGTGANLVMASATTVRLGGYTVATLPAAGTAGRTAYVTDATAPTYLGALTGGGDVVCPVFDNGVAWVSA